MSLHDPLEALKNKDFPRARALIASTDMATYTLQHFLIRGLAELQMQDWPSALETLTMATKRFPDYPLFWLNRGIAEENLYQFDQAIASQRQCLALDHRLAESYGNLSNLYCKVRRFIEAEEMARQALAYGAAKGDALNSLGLALYRQGKFTEARVIFLEAQAAAPDNPFVLLNSANLEVEVFNFDHAWNLFAAARSLSNEPIIRHDEALGHLLAGDYKNGWRLFESRLEMPTALRQYPLCPRWCGENLKNKKLLILAEQGLGDVIQFSRYEKSIMTSDLVWAVPESLVRLLSGQVGGTVLCENEPLPQCDYYVPILSLPFLTDHIQPMPVEKILIPPSTPVLPAGQYTKKIGLVWTGSLTHQRNYERSIDLKFFTNLIKEIPADFYAPFTGIALRDTEDTSIIRLDHLIKDFADTSALLAQMDCLITVDTAVAHLAGTMGIKTYLLLSYCPDWRWGTTGEITAWYPSVTLLRQNLYGDWQSPIETLTNLLKGRLGETT